MNICKWAYSKHQVNLSFSFTLDKTIIVTSSHLENEIISVKPKRRKLDFSNWKSLVQWYNYNIQIQGKMKRFYPQ